MPPFNIVLPVVALAGIAVLGRVTFRTWLHPGAFFALMWLFLIVFSLSAPVFGAEQYHIWYAALWWIDLTIVCVYFGSMLGERVASAPAIAALNPSSARDFHYVLPLLVASAIGGVVWPIAVPQLVVFGDHPPMYLQVFLGLHYLGPLIGGLLYPGARERKHKLLSLATLLTGLFFGIVDTGRSKIVIQFSYWFCGYFIMLIFMNRQRPVPLFSRARTLGGAICIALFVVVGVVFTPLRGVTRELPVNEKLQEYGQVLTAETISSSWEWMHPSIFGHPAMFSSYFEMAWKNPPTVPKFPQQTAAGIYRAFGYELPEPLYTDVGGQPTNVFTIFKPPIEDFTLPGSLVIFCGWGALSAWAYRKLQLGLLWPGVLLAHYYANATNIGGNLLTYNSQTGAFIIVGVYLFYLERFGPLCPRVLPEAPMRPTWDAAPATRVIA